MAEAGIGSNRFGDEAFGAGDGVGERHAQGKTGGDGSGIGTAGSMGVGSIEAFAGELVEEAILGVEEIEGCALEMAALDEDGAGAHEAELEGGLAHGLWSIHGEAGENGGLMEVRGDEKGPRHEGFREHLAGLFGDEGSAVLADHDGIDDEREGKAGGGGGDRFNHRGVAEGAGFRSLGRNIGEHSVQLADDKGGVKDLDGVHGESVLDGEQGDDCLTVGAELMEGFEVRLDTRASAGV